MIKLSNLIPKSFKDKAIDDEKIDKAFKFFKSKLSLNEYSIKYTLGYDNKDNNEDDDGEIEYKRSVDTNEYLSFLIRLNDKLTTDRIVKALVHELIHVKQLVDGKLDKEENMWDGKPITSYKNYWHEPWEIEARIESDRLWIEFNKANRDNLL